MYRYTWLSFRVSVAPFAGAWIEIAQKAFATPHPPVAPFAGAWIEMYQIKPMTITTLVAPFAGAWIEMERSLLYRHLMQSLPSRERGLKWYYPP